MPKDYILYWLDVVFIYKDPDGKSVFAEEEYNKGVSNMRTSQYILME